MFGCVNINYNLNLSYIEKKILFIAIFCVGFVTTNIVTVKIWDLGFLGLTVPCGVVIYPLVYILTCVITEVYGESTARKTIFLGLLTNVLFVLISTLVLLLPAAPFWTGQDSYSFIFTQTPRILLASFVSYVIGNLVNARLTAILKENAEGKNIGFKSIGAIAIGEIIDNAIFIAGAFAFTVSWNNIVIMILVHFIIMFIWTFIAQPITMRTVKWAKKGENNFIN